MSGTLAASISISPAPLMIPSWSRSHCTAEPVTAIEPSSAYTGSLSPNWYATVVSSPCWLRTSSAPVVMSRKLPVP